MTLRLDGQYANERWTGEHDEPEPEVCDVCGEETCPHGVCTDTGSPRRPRCERAEDCEECICG